LARLRLLCQAEQVSSRNWPELIPTEAAPPEGREGDAEKPADEAPGYASGLIGHLRAAVAQLGDATDADRALMSGLVAFEQTLTSRAAFDNLLERTGRSPLEALFDFPERLASTVVTAIERGWLPRDPTAAAPSTMPSPTAVPGSAGTAGQPPVSVPHAVEASPADVASELFHAAMREIGATPREFEEALSAAFDDGLGLAAASGPREADMLRERFAEVAAAVHLVPGGADAVQRYASRRRGDPKVRRWAGRVRTIVRVARLPLPKIPASTARRGHARRTPRRRARHCARPPCRAGPHGDPEPDGLVPAHVQANGGAS
jgi:hypothetical protein